VSGRQKVGFRFRGEKNLRGSVTIPLRVQSPLPERAYRQEKERKTARPRKPTKKNQSKEKPTSLVAKFEKGRTPPTLKREATRDRVGTPHYYRKKKGKIILKYRM